MHSTRRPSATGRAPRHVAGIRPPEGRNVLSANTVKAANCSAVVWLASLPGLSRNGNVRASFPSLQAETSKKPTAVDTAPRHRVRKTLSAA